MTPLIYYLFFNFLGESVQVVLYTNYKTEFLLNKL